MFSNRIANSARFLQMPAESQLLYFHMVLRADDDGVVESYPLMKMLGLAPDNFKVLEAKGFIKLLNDDQVVLVMNWIEHNKIRADRKVNSIYLPLIKNLYPELPTIEPKPRSDVDDNSRRINGGQSTVGISKDKLSKDKIIEDNHFSSFWDSYPRKEGKKNAEKSWLKIDPKLHDIILSALKEHCESEQWLKDGGRFIPHPATWLNQERWNDEIKRSNNKPIKI